METPIDHPSVSLRQESLGTIKKEKEGEEQEQSSLESASWGPIEESFTSESGTRSSEAEKSRQESHGDDSALTGVSGSDPDQDTTGEGASGMEV